MGVDEENYPLGGSSATQGSSGMTQDVAGYVTDLLNALNTHDLERIASFYADDFEGEDVGAVLPQHGSHERVQVFASFVQAFPDLQFTGAALAEGDQVALFWTMTGTHHGTIMRIPATGRSVRVRGVSLLTITDGKITRGLQIWDTAGFFRSLGLLPDL